MYAERPWRAWPKVKSGSIWTIEPRFAIYGIETIDAVVSSWADITPGC